ncbi:unnamed protein product, partial [Musa acuminata subsp. malaccensis]
YSSHRGAEHKPKVHANKGGEQKTIKAQKPKAKFFNRTQVVILRI